MPVILAKSVGGRLHLEHTYMLDPWELKWAFISHVPNRYSERRFDESAIPVVCLISSVTAGLMFASSFCCLASGVAGKNFVFSHLVKWEETCFLIVIIIIVQEICKAPTLFLKVLNNAD